MLPTPLHQFLRTTLSPEAKTFIRKHAQLVNYAHYPRCWANKQRLSRLLQQNNGRVHLGCSRRHLTGFLNLDIRPTSATDIVHDCSNLSLFPAGSLNLLFSNAFFEHLYRPEQLPLLRDALRALAPGGLILFTGIPDFYGVARAYLDRNPGNIGERFDLYEAYRYTHGDPENQPGFWLAQLHKSLFDADALVTLARNAGFPAGVVFSYKFGNEPNRVTLGLAAKKPAAQHRNSPEPLTIDQLPIPEYVNIAPGTLQIESTW